MADSWRFDYTGCYGNPWIQTPNVDQLANEGTLFKYAYTEYPYTPPTREACATGRYTFPFGFGKIPQFLSIINILTQNGYTTAYITDIKSSYFEMADFVQKSEQWRSPKLRWLKGEVNIDHYYKDYGDGPCSSQGSDAQKRSLLTQHLRDRLTWRSDAESYAARVYKNGIRWLESMKGKDHLFLWIDSWDPHEPWDPPSPYDRMYTDPNYDGKEIIWPNMGPVKGYLTEDELNHIKALYAGEVTMVDKWIGQFLDRARELGFLDNTLIIFLSDHGSPFGEHGFIRKALNYTFEELAHVPFIIRHPDGIGRGRRVNAFTDTTDVMPTILDFLHIPIPRTAHGHSLIPLISGEEEKVRDYAYSGQFGSSWMIRDEEWKLIIWLPRIIRQDLPPWLLHLYGIGRGPELYHLSEDPEEKRNLIIEEPMRAESLELRLRRFIAGLSPPPITFPAGRPDLGPGYLVA